MLILSPRSPTWCWERSSSLAYILARYFSSCIRVPYIYSRTSQHQSLFKGKKKRRETLGNDISNWQTIKETKRSPHQPGGYCQLSEAVAFRAPSSCRAPVVRAGAHRGCCSCLLVVHIAKPELYSSTNDDESTFLDLEYSSSHGSIQPRDFDLRLIVRFRVSMVTC